MSYCYCYYQAPTTKLVLIANEDTLARVVFENEPYQEAIASYFAIQDASNHILAQAVNELHLYFEGRLSEFKTPLDLSELPAYRREVLQALQKTPYGCLLTYKQLAELTSSPLAIRAVASSMANNPLAIFIPCHRVVPSSLELGKYSGGVETKLYLQQLEARH